jgi:hypothetical protein
VGLSRSRAGLVAVLTPRLSASCSPASHQGVCRAGKRKILQPGSYQVWCNAFGQNVPTELLLFIQQTELEDYVP